MEIIIIKILKKHKFLISIKHQLIKQILLLVLRHALQVTNMQWNHRNFNRKPMKNKNHIIVSRNGDKFE